MPLTHLVECPECEGTGGAVLNDDVLHDCPSCGATGSIERQGPGVTTQLDMKDALWRMFPTCP